MNIIFFASSDFALPSLEALLTARHNISCVVTQPDRPRGRRLVVSATSVKITAAENKLKIHQPARVNNSETIKLLKRLNPDLFIVISYGQILSQQLLDIPKVIAINLHASLLPKYRGAAPINWAIINGEKITGVTIIKITPKMDSGPIISWQSMDIADSDTSVSMEHKLSFFGAQLLLDAVDNIERNKFSLMPQDETKASFAPKLKKDDGRINWDKPAYQIHNLVRGTLAWPGAFTSYKDKLLKIYQTHVCPPDPIAQERVPGEIVNVSREGIVVATAKDNLAVTGLQLEGKRIMKAEEFLAGHRICVGETLK